MALLTLTATQILHSKQMAKPSGDLGNAIAHQSAGRFEQAAAIYRQLFAESPDDAYILYLLAVVEYQLGRYDLAAEYGHKSLKNDPNNADAWNIIGLVRGAKGQPDEAVACFNQALQLRPNFPVAYNNLGNTLRRRKSNGEAIVCYRQAIQLNPDYADAYANLGNALKDSGDVSEAVRSYAKAISLDPTFAEAHYNLGCIALEHGKFPDAETYFSNAIAIKPSLPDPHLSRATLRLLTGDFEHGLDEYEWRWKTGQIPVRNASQPEWDGSSIAGKTILLHAEQGLGDTFQFIRYAAMVKERSATVVLESPKQLHGILALVSGIDQLCNPEEALSKFDLHAPLLSLPRIFGTTLDTIPSKVPYLFADAALKLLWRNRLETADGFQIGISWRGQIGYGALRNRAIPLNHFFTLSAVPGSQLICIQKEHSSTELEALTSNRQLVRVIDDFDSSHGAFMDTAAIMTNLDLVITADSAIAHLAGGLGVPVWVALPFVPDWRWLLDRSDSPWYPSMRLFRQKRAGDWAGVFEEIHAALQDFVEQKSA